MDGEELRGFFIFNVQNNLYDRNAAINSTLTAILGREAAAAGKKITMKDLLAANKKIEVDTSGLVQ